MVRLTPKVLLATWEKFRLLPGGKRLFSRLVGWMAPYSGSVGAIVEKLGHGEAEISLSDRRAVRNHLRSIHAMALANLGELATGLAVNTAIPSSAQAILVSFSVDYLKKARGTLTASCRVAALEKVTEPLSKEAVATIRNAQGEEVARAKATWRIGPTP